MGCFSGLFGDAEECAGEMFLGSGLCGSGGEGEAGGGDAGAGEGVEGLMGGKVIA